MRPPSGGGALPVRELLACMAGDRRYSAHIAQTVSLDATPPVYGTTSDPLPDGLEAFLTKKRIRLYSHQCEAIDRIRRGEDLILTSSTASGKTLAFTLPIIEALCADPSATAIFLYPTKALANDQLTMLRGFEEFLGLDSRAAIYDGDTPRDRRAGIRERSRIILSNPYELHLILPWHTRWERFLSGLRFVVIDEAHRYRGIFGSHGALLLRRLRRICAHYGSSPLFILSTATIANPAEFAAWLTGRPVSAVEGDGAPRAERHLIFYNPLETGRTTAGEAKALLVLSVLNGCQTICFTGSRRLAEEIAADAAILLEREGHHGRVAAYRAGYLAEERREIEENLKSGVLSGVVATSALELGIDVGGLDVAILTGFPGSMMATRQQAGRAGRRGQESLVVLVAGADPLDQYFMRHPDTLLSRPTEHAIINPENPYVLTGHLLCAAAELPIDPERDRAFFGPGLDAAIESLATGHLISRTRRGIVYSGRGNPASLVNLDGISQDLFRVICNGRLTETMNRRQAYREAHPGAVLLHGGETYIVRNFDPAGCTIRVERTDVDYRTRPLCHSDIKINRVYRFDRYNRLTVGWGEITVTEVFSGYLVRHFGVTVGQHKLDLPPLTFPTEAVWTVLPDIGEITGGPDKDPAGGIHAAEHALIAALPLRVLCDREDVGGLSTLHHPDTGDATIFFYDGMEGGIGLAGTARHLLPEIVRDALDIVSSCRCRDGCPSCIQSPRCGNDNRPLDKGAALAILGWLADELETAPLEEIGTTVNQEGYSPEAVPED
ncbi:MAG: DEAD/DEAH box helicase [Methanoculleaceae archaeon]